jgi:hypothetical protein
MKDARWQLAYKYTVALSWSWDKMSYPQRDAMLSLAQTYLDEHPEEIKQLSDEWNNRV